MDDLQRIKNQVLNVINTRTDTYVQRRVVTLSDQLLALQDQFFTIMVQKGIDVTSAPSLGVYTAEWGALSKKYARTKKKLTHPGFYYYSGRLKAGLLRSKATTAFGKPLVKVSSNKSGDGAVTYKAGKTLKLQDLRKSQNRYLVIQLYPKVKENLKALRAEDYGQYIPGRRAIKLATRRGSETRPYLANYMNWWLDTKAMAVIKRNLK